MENVQIKKILKLSIFTVAALGVFQDALAENRELEAKNITRISHPAYDVTNIGYGYLEPWNVDHSRILLNEQGILTNNTYENWFHPSFPTSFINARGLRRTKSDWNTDPANKAWGVWVSVGNGTWKNALGYKPDGVSDEVGKYLSEQSTGGTLSPNRWYWSPANGGELYIRLESNVSPATVSATIYSNGRGKVWGCLNGNCIAEAANRNEKCTENKKPFACCTGSGVGNCEPYSTLQDLHLETAADNQSLIDWDNNTMKIPAEMNSLVWSPYEGETSVVYALCHDYYNYGFCHDNKVQDWLITYDIDSGYINKVFDFSLAGGCSDTSKICKSACVAPNTWTGGTYDTCHTNIIGFTKDATTNNLGHGNQIVLMYNYGSTAQTGGSSNTTSNSIIIVDTHRTVNNGGVTFPGAATITGYSKHNTNMTKGLLSCNEEMEWYPQIHSVHGSVSYDGKYEHNSDATFKIEDRNDSCSRTIPPSTYYTGAPYFGNFWTQDTISRGGNGSTPITPNPGGDLLLDGRIQNTSGITHITMSDLNDWYIAGNSSSFPFDWVMLDRPNVQVNGERIWQVNFNREKFDEVLAGKTNCNDDNNPFSMKGECECPLCFTHIPLITRSNVGGWTLVDNNSSCSVSTDCKKQHYPYCTRGRCIGESINYQAYPMPMVSEDATLLKFQGTNGKYSREDKSWCDIITPNMCSTIGDSWEGIGTYIADIVPKGGNISSDVNGDGKVNIKDIQAVIRCIINLEGCEFPDQSDINKDGSVNIKDIKEIIRKIVSP